MQRQRRQKHGGCALKCPAPFVYTHADLLGRVGWHNKNTLWQCSECWVLKLRFCLYLLTTMFEKMLINRQETLHFVMVP